MTDEEWAERNRSLRLYVSTELDQHARWEVPDPPDRHSRAWVHLTRRDPAQDKP